MGKRGRPKRRERMVAQASRRIRPGGRTPRTSPFSQAGLAARPRSARAAAFGCPDPGARVWLLLCCISHRAPLTHRSPAPSRKSRAGVASFPRRSVPGRSPPPAPSATARPRPVISGFFGALHRDFPRTRARIGPCRTPPPNGSLSSLFVTDHWANPWAAAVGGAAGAEKGKQILRSWGLAAAAAGVWCVVRAPALRGGRESNFEA